jgi:hypothetical protein
MFIDQYTFLSKLSCFKANFYQMSYNFDFVSDHLFSRQIPFTLTISKKRKKQTKECFFTTLAGSALFNLFGRTFFRQQAPPL